MIEKQKKKISKMLIVIGVFTLTVMVLTFIVSLWLLAQVQDNKSLEIITTFVILQLAGFIVLIIVFGFFSAYYEYNEYWALSMWDKLLDIGSRLKKIEKKLEIE